MRSTVITISALVVGAALLISGRALLEGKRTFPLLSPGAYVGMLIPESSAGSHSPMPMYLERLPKCQEIIAFVSAEGWNPQVLPLEGSDTGDGVVAPPLAIKGLNEKLLLTGERMKEGGASGVVVSGDTMKAWGRWKISPFLKAPENLAAEDKKIILSWLTAKIEEEKATDALDAIEQSKTRLSAEVSRLQGFMEERISIQARSDRKKMALDQVIDENRARLQNVEESLTKLNSKLMMSVKVNGRGRLSLSSRESLNQENHLIQTVLAARAPVPDEVLLQRAADKMHELFRLKKLINEERKRIEILKRSRGIVNEQGS